MRGSGRARVIRRRRDASAAAAAAAAAGPCGAPAGAWRGFPGRAGRTVAPNRAARPTGRARGGPGGARGPRPCRSGRASPRGGPRPCCWCPWRRLWPRRARGAGPRRRLRALPYHVEPGGLAPARADRAHRLFTVENGIVLAPELADGAPVRGGARPFRRERYHARRPRRRRRGRRQREALGPLGAILLDRSHAQVAQRGCLGQGHPALEGDVRHQLCAVPRAAFWLQFAPCGSFGLHVYPASRDCQRERCGNAERFCRSRERASLLTASGTESCG